MTVHSLPRAENLGVTEILSGARHVASNWLKRRRLYQLQRLDDHMLNDIGLKRSDIRHMIWGGR